MTRFFSTTNIEEEYEALVVGLDLAKAVGAMSVVVYYDSQTANRRAHSNDSPVAFYSIRLDIIGPFPMAMRQLKFLVVGIVYFTKLVEVEALATITEKNVQSFVWRNIIYKYGIPKVLVSDNGKKFDNDSFRDFCSQLGIKNHYSSLAYP
nr:uncharacterized protein LOC112002220 [Quercus suber]